jgi:hypothetical protein
VRAIHPDEKRYAFLIYKFQVILAYKPLRHLEALIEDFPTWLNSLSGSLIIFILIYYLRL